jgi:prephenate dehydrogenase
MSKSRIAIIGGSGGMGSLFQKHFTSAGVEVLVGSRKIPGSYEHAVRNSDVVIISVPISAIPETLKSIKPFLAKDHLVVDFSSVQSVHHKVLGKLPCACVSVHPLFGPKVDNLQGQTFVFSKQNNIKHKKISLLKEVFVSMGGMVIDMDPKAHDSAMALIQALVHAVHITSASVTAKFKSAKNGKALQLDTVSTPVSRLQEAVTGRIFNQPAELYANILMTNPEALRVIDAEIAALSGLRKMVANKDNKKFEKEFNKTKESIGESKLKVAMEHSNRMLKEITNKEI